MPCLDRNQRRIWRAALALVTLALPGCVMPPDFYSSYAYPDYGYATYAAPPIVRGPQLIPQHLSMVALPPELAAARLAVRRDVGSTMVVEDVMLTNDTLTPHGNRVTVRTATRRPTLFFLTGGFRGTFTKESIDLALAREFPAATQISPAVEARNAQGRYAYQAVRNADGAMCIFAWQSADAIDAYERSVQTHALEFRFCDADASIETLRSYFDGISLQMVG